MSYNIILVDDHHIVRQGLSFLLDTVPDFNIQADFSSGVLLLEYLEQHESPDIVLLDLQLLLKCPFSPQL